MRSCLLVLSVPVLLMFSLPRSVQAYDLLGSINQSYQQQSAFDQQQSFQQQNFVLQQSQQQLDQYIRNDTLIRDANVAATQDCAFNGCQNSTAIISSALSQAANNTSQVAAQTTAAQQNFHANQLSQKFSFDLSQLNQSIAATNASIVSGFNRITASMEQNRRVGPSARMSENYGSDAFVDGAAAGFNPATNTELGGGLNRQAQLAGIEFGNTLLSAINQDRPGLEPVSTKSDTFYRGYYGGVHKTYADAGFNPATQALPNGPTNAFIRGYDASSNDHQASLGIDAGYRSGEISVVALPGEIVVSGADAAGVTSVQELGRRSGITVLGNATYLDSIASFVDSNGHVDPNLFKGAAGGLIFISDDVPDLKEVLRHEYDHAGVLALSRISQTIAENNYSIVQGGQTLSFDKNKTDLVYRDTVSMWQGQTVAEVFSVPVITAPAGSSAEIKENVKYFNEALEMRAFLAQRNDPELIRYMSQKGIPSSQANELISLVKNSPTYQVIDRRLEGMANELLAGQNGYANSWYLINQQRNADAEK